MEENKTNEVKPLPKCVIFDENNNVQMAEEGKTILAFIMGDSGIKIALNGYVTETLLKTLKNDMPKIMDNLIEDFVKEANKKAQEQNIKTINENKDDKEEK